jgi:hypothetical protein
VTASDGAFEERVEIAGDFVEHATEYRVYRCPLAGDACTALNDWSTATTHTGASVETGRYYYYCVKSRNPADESDYSAADLGWPELPPSTDVRRHWSLCR